MSKNARLGVPPIGHFWIKMMIFNIFIKNVKKCPIGGTPNRAFLNKNVKKCQKMQFLMFLSKNAIFDKNVKKMTDWGYPPIGHFWIKMSKNDRGVPPIGHFWIKMSKNAIFDVFIKKCNFWCFYQKMADLGVPPIGHNGRLGVPPIDHFWIKTSKMADFEGFWKKVQNRQILKVFIKTSKSVDFE